MTQGGTESGHDLERLKDLAGRLSIGRHAPREAKDDAAAIVRIIVEHRRALQLIADLISYSGLREKVRLRDDPTEYAEAERLLARADSLLERGGGTDPPIS